MAIKRYRTAFLIQAQTTTKDAVYGQAEPTWTDETRVYWGELAEGSGNRKRHAQQIENRAETVVTLRGAVTVSANDRLKVKSSGVVYRIEGVYSDGTDTVVECYRQTEQ